MTRLALALLLVLPAFGCRSPRPPVSPGDEVTAPMTEEDERALGGPQAVEQVTPSTTPTPAPSDAGP